MAMKRLDWTHDLTERYSSNEDLNALCEKQFTGSVTIHFYEGKPEAIERNQKIKGKIV